MGLTAVSQLFPDEAKMIPPVAHGKYAVHSPLCLLYASIVPANVHAVPTSAGIIYTEAGLSTEFALCTAHSTNSACDHIKTNSLATLTAFSRPNSFSTMARANSVAVPGALLVIRFPSITTLFSHRLWSVSRCAMGGNDVTFLPYNGEEVAYHHIALSFVKRNERWKT